MRIDQVLDEYRRGDQDKRLSLFLYFRELRAAFSHVEQDDGSRAGESALQEPCHNHDRGAGAA